MRHGLAVALLVIVTLAMAVSANAATITATAHLRNGHTVVLPPLGRSGDAYTAVWLVHDRTGNAIGDMLIDCRWVTGTLRLCVGQLSLPLGTLAVMGASRTQFIGQFAIVGGIGRYVGAKGTLLFSATGTGRYVVAADFTQPN